MSQWAPGADRVQQMITLGELQRTRKSPQQITNYVTLLQQIGYVKRENGTLVPGREFPRGTSDQTPTPEALKGMTADSKAKMKAVTAPNVGSSTANQPAASKPGSSNTIKPAPVVP